MLDTPSRVRHPNPALSLCQDCPPVGYPTNDARCISCPRNQSEAYNLGCDARNDGKPIDENPYEPGDHPVPYVEFSDWDRGWQDTDCEREAEGD